MRVDRLQCLVTLDNAGRKKNIAGKYNSDRSGKTSSFKSALPCVYGSHGLIEKHNVCICMIRNVLFATKSNGD